jgi:hypothetical protein
MKHIRSFTIYESNLPSSELNEFQIEFLDKHTEKKWDYNTSTGLVDVDGDFDCRKKHLTTLPVDFGKVSGDFHCGFNNLTTLEGAPKEVGGSFICHYNKLTTLEGAPEKVGGHFNCNRNKLTTLEGVPKEIGGFFISDEFSLEEGKWNPEGWTKILKEGKQEAKEMVLPLIGLEDLNREIRKNPEEMVIALKGFWNSPEFASIRKDLVIPDRYVEEMDTLGDLSDLGF